MHRKLVNKFTFLLCFHVADLIEYFLCSLEIGHSILFVGLYNPKGPCEEVQVKHTGKNTFTVNYYIRERSEYTLFVMWGQDHIPGSPFSIEVPNK